MKINSRAAIFLGFLLAFSPGLAQAQKEAGAKDLPVKSYFGEHIRMRDGVLLAADVYRPDTTGKVDCIVNRTPYLKNSQSALKLGRYFASHGYAFVVVDVRGRGDSEGEFVPYRNEGKDGYDAIEWCATQPWSTGRVGTIGGSYNGKNQWLAAVEQPPHLVTMIALVSPSDPFVEFPTGEPSPMEASWYYLTSGHVLQNMEAVDWNAVNNHLPLLTADEATGRRIPAWKEQFAHAQLDGFWEPEEYQTRYSRVQVPVLHISGWYDDEQVGTPLNYIGMTTKAPLEVRGNQKLIMGPWPHAVNSTSKLGEVDFGPSATIDMNNVWLRWFDAWLKGVDNGVRAEPPVHIFLMGANQWMDEKEWPLAKTHYAEFYFHGTGRSNTLYGDGKLSESKPTAEKPDSFTYDPADPVPFITDPSFEQIGGPDDYRAVERRDDVLVYTSDPVQQDTEVCGPIKVTLYAATSGKDTDFTAKLLDVWPSGFAERLSDGIVRARFRNGMQKQEAIAPGTAYEYQIDAWNTCQMLKPGHRFRVEISSSAFPKYSRNLNNGEALGKTAEMMVARQTIYHDAAHPSRITLPIIETTEKSK